ncbi:MAG: hypothetical protein ABR915_08845 [Thermoguttaceae bacterium]|jgi:biofilm protein TabA
MMRKIAEVRESNRGDVVRAMIYEAKDGTGTYLFLYDALHDGPCTFDYWYKTRSEAERHCTESFGIRPSDWQLIDDPWPGCQHDWIAPTRLKRDAQGNPLSGEGFEPAND